ncbi:MAG TPA: hypothetical protein VML01_13175 [Bryobacterales bacterium]|nr:hypothetical protein [Bryobacterales bacterium]
MAETRVVAVTQGPSGLIREVASLLQRQGLDYVEVDSADQVPAGLRADNANAVLIYSAPGKRTARALIEALRANRGDVPVIVLVDRADMDEFHELMCAGAYDYFEIGEGAHVVAEALRWAAHANAVPPRSYATRRPAGSEPRQTAACASR